MRSLPRVSLSGQTAPVRMMRVVRVFVAGAIFLAACSGDSTEFPASPSITATVATTASSTEPDAVDCPELDGREVVVRGHALTVVPEEFTLVGDVVTTSTGSDDLGGETHSVQRFGDRVGRWIEFDAFGMESPAAYIEELMARAPTESVTYAPCVDLSTGTQRVEYTTAISRQPDRTILATQEWEYGGFSVSSHPDVALADLLAIASGLRTPKSP